MMIPDYFTSPAVLILISTEHVRWRAEAPAVVVTATSTVVAFSLGANTVIRVGETTENRAAMPPNETPVKLVLVIVTISPPAVEPDSHSVLAARDRRAISARLARAAS